MKQSSKSRRRPIKQSYLSAVSKILFKLVTIKIRLHNAYRYVVTRKHYLLTFNNVTHDLILTELLL